MFVHVHPCMHAKLLQLCPALCDAVDHSPPGSSAHQDSPNKNTRVGCHVLLQGISSTEGSNPRLFRLLHWYISSLPLPPPGKPKYIYICVCVCLCMCIYKPTILQLKIKRIKSHDIKTLLDNLGHILTTGCLYLLGF